jgi:multidrug efflux pump subunit AcrB
MDQKPNTKSGAIAWMARNHVTANLLMLTFILGGLLMTGKIKQEVFPDLQMDYIFVTVPYPGASPEEVEEGVVLAIEEELRGLDVAKDVTATCREGMGIVAVELLMGSDPNKALSDVRNAVDRIRTFPRDMERYTVSLVESRRHVISIMIHGDQSETDLRKLAEKVREDLLKNDGITQVDLSGVRRPEIAVEISQEQLRRYNLTLEQVAALIRAGSLDLPGGLVKTSGGEVLIRTTERRYLGREYEDLPLITTNEGAVVTLGEIARVRDTFEETDVAAMYNGEPAVRIDIYRVGDETPTGVSRAVKAYIEELNEALPPTVHASVWEDTSELLEARINLLVRNALLGLMLVLLLLGFSLDLRLAFWVTLGIPISILGALFLFPAVDLSINMISLFAIIITIGIVVDDAVIIGENIHHHRKQHETYLEAAIAGTREMAIPVTFSILTNIAAFLPLFFVPGVTGKIFKVIPTAVVMIFAISLIEALFILPAHLSRRPKSEDSGLIHWANQRREWFGNMIQWLREVPFARSLTVALRWRYITLALAVTVLLLSIGVVGSGRLDFSFMPKIEAERITAAAELPFGTPIEVTRQVQARLLETLDQVIEENGGDRIRRGIYTQVGTQPPAGGMISVGSRFDGAHMTDVSIYLVPIDQREISAEAFVSQWKRKLGRLPGVESLLFSFTTGPSSNQPINLMISHPETDVLETAATDLAGILSGYAGVRDINDGFSSGKVQLDFRIKPEAQSLGLSAADLARQVRSAFYGAEALRVQRGRDEVKVLVRLPEDERKSQYDIEELIIRTPMGVEIPIREAAEVIRGISYTEIRRSNSRRVLNVTADVEAGVANATKVVASVRAAEIPGLLEKYPGLKSELDGEQKDQQEAMSALGFGFLMTLFGIYALLAIPFKNYAQPLIIMISIPFGIIGAVIGHIIMGYELSVISMFGIIALAGVVVNDSLILVDAANRNRWSGMSQYDSIFRAATRRFRPILLTSLTTFLGLAPMIFETSLQARFLIPMAISLGFGILFATGIALVIIPCFYLVLIDIRGLLGLRKREVKLA